MVRTFSDLSVIVVIITDRLFMKKMISQPAGTGRTVSST